MKRDFLLPSGCRPWGYVLAIPSMVLLSLFYFFDIPLRLDTFLYGYCDELLITCLITGLLFVGFSKTACEDEYVEHIRNRSLLWALVVNYTILIACTWFVYDLMYLNVMLVGQFSVLVLYIIKFYYELHKFRKSIGNEE